ncbi:hypothetical protein Hanom_Chr00s001222g01677001 [Helianthus anomalus]
MWVGYIDYRENVETKVLCNQSQVFVFTLNVQKITMKIQQKIRHTSMAINDLERVY